MKCASCGVSEISTGDVGGICLSCRNQIEMERYKKATQYFTGWICPKCGSVYGPSASECDRCNPSRKYEVTC